MIYYKMSGVKGFDEKCTLKSCKPSLNQARKTGSKLSANKVARGFDGFAKRAQALLRGEVEAPYRFARLYAQAYNA